MFGGVGTLFYFITTYHQVDGQTERKNQNLEDMLCIYLMDQPTKREYYIHLVDLAYNNSCYESMNMSPFEAI